MLPVNPRCTTQKKICCCVICQLANEHFGSKRFIIKQTFERVTVTNATDYRAIRQLLCHAAIGAIGRNSKLFTIANPD